MAQTAPDTSDPAAGAEQTMPGTSPGTSGTDGTAAQDQTMPGMPDAGDTQATDPMAADAAAGPATLDQHEGNHQPAEDSIGATVLARPAAGREGIGPRSVESCVGNVGVSQYICGWWPYS